MAASAATLPAMRLDPDHGDTIRLVSLLAGVLVCFNHAYTLDVPYAALAGQPHAAWTAFVQNVEKFGAARLSTPFFFIVASWLFTTALLRREDGRTAIVPLRVGYGGEVAKRIRSLAVPFLLWAAWSFALIAGLQQVPALAPYFSRPLLDLPATEIAGLLLWNPVAHPLWFVRDLLLLCCAWPLVWLLLRRREVGVAVIAALCVPWFLWHEVRETRALVFFALGAWLAIHRPHLPALPGWGLALCGAAWAAGASAHAWWVMRADATHPVLNNLTILVALATVWYGMQRLLPLLRGRRWLMAATAHTFVVYCAHEPIATLARKATVSIAGETPLQLFVAWIVAGAGTFLGCLTGAILLHRLWPGLSALLSGGRGRRRSAPLARTPVATLARRAAAGEA